MSARGAGGFLPAVNAFFQTRAALWLALPVGAALSLAFAPFDWWWLAILCIGYLFLAWREAAPARAAKLAFLFTAGTYLAGTYWLYHSIYEIGHAPIWLTIFVMLALVAIMAAYAAGLGYVLARWLPGSVSGATAMAAFPVARALLIVPAAWIFMEWFRGWFLSGFPWLALGYSQMDTPLAGFAPVGGVYSVSLMVAICAGALVVLIGGTTRQRLLAAGVLAAPWLIGFLLWGREWTASLDRPVTVAIVQGAVPQEMKWSPDQRDATIDLYRSLTRPHLGADIVIWPEAALPALVHEVSDILRAQWQEARDKGSAMVIGQIRYDFDTKVYYNAVVALDAQAQQAQWYAKRRLVPFSEFFPVPNWVSEWLRGMDLPYSGFRAGERDQPALEASGEKLALTICYEDAYAAEQLNVLKDATLLVNVTNDAWFGDSTAAHQHLQISRMRALEAGRPLLRAANDGISAILDAQGAIEKTLPRFEPGVLTGVVQPRSGLTPYARVGNVPVIALCCMVLLGAFLIMWRARSPHPRFVQQGQR